MILSGARGTLQKFDAESMTLTLSGRSGSREFEIAAESNSRGWSNLVGRSVLVQLCDFLVVDVTEEQDSPN